jgi:hypothetical protein
MGFHVTNGKLKHIQNIDDILWRGKVVYNTIAFFSIVIGALALVAFLVRLFISAILKENNHFINK